jgi:hypothetical protein
LGVVDGVTVGRLARLLVSPRGGHAPCIDVRLYRPRRAVKEVDLDEILFPARRIMPSPIAAIDVQSAVVATMIGRSGRTSVGDRMDSLRDCLLCMRFARINLVLNDLGGAR